MIQRTSAADTNVIPALVAGIQAAAHAMLNINRVLPEHELAESQCLHSYATNLARWTPVTRTGVTVSVQGSASEFRR